MCGFVFGLCFAIYLTEEERERPGCFALIVFMLSYDCQCSMNLPCWPVICDCGFSWTSWTFILVGIVI